MKFDRAYMSHRMHIAWRGPLIADAIIETLAPQVVLDLGCATGDIAAALLTRGVTAWGVDSSPDAGECLPWYRMVYCDLKNTAGHLQLLRDALITPVDLAMLLEVLSVVPDSDRAQILTQTMACARQLLINQLHPLDTALLAANGWHYDHDVTAQLLELLAPQGKKQAVKAIFRTGEIWRKA